MGFFDKIKNGLKKTKENMVKQMEHVFHSFTKIDEELFEELEEILIMSDVGVNTSMRICEQLRKTVKERGIKDPAQVRELLKEIMIDMLSGGEELNISTQPSMILVIGVNGVGKTTTIGKLAAHLKSQGKKVILGAADTCLLYTSNSLKAARIGSAAAMLKEEMRSLGSLTMACAAK